jgi:hypothetical protein
MSIMTPGASKTFQPLAVRFDLKNCHCVGLRDSLQRLVRPRYHHTVDY